MNMMLTRDKLYSLEQYSRIRSEFRTTIIEHKESRRVALGEHATLHFEDSLTMQYQVQEMLRLERIFDAHGIEQELEVYNPLIPDGANWKATFMIEYEDVDERHQALKLLAGIEKTVWVKVEGCNRVYAIANEDLARETDGKTSAVHFLRFELAPEMISLVKQDAAICAGIDHPSYQAKVLLQKEVRDSLEDDLD